MTLGEETGLLLIASEDRSVAPSQQLLEYRGTWARTRAQSCRLPRKICMFHGERIPTTNRSCYGWSVLQHQRGSGSGSSSSFRLPILRADGARRHPDRRSATSTRSEGDDFTGNMDLANVETEPLILEILRVRRACFVSRGAGLPHPFHVEHRKT